MKRRVFLDTNIFIYAFEFPDSNSGKVIDLLNKGQIEAVISEQACRFCLLMSMETGMMGRVRICFL